jgi:ribulose 1,5-bisphosphate synthetase/thiazole synthase
MAVFSRLATAVQLFSIILTPALGAVTSKDYDYVIVGGGVTGLVVANRLTEDKRGEF